MAREGALQLEAVLVDRRAQRDLEALIIAIASAGVSRYPSRHVCFTKTTSLLTQLQGGGSHGESSSLRLDLGTAFRSEVRSLDAEQARQHRPVLLAILSVADMAWCSPHCCSAAAARRDLFETKVLAVRSWATLDPDVSLLWSSSLLARLLDDRSNPLARAACELLRASPQGTVHHLDGLAARAATHPRWPIQWELVRTISAGLSRAVSEERRAGWSALIEPLTQHPQRQLQKDAQRLMALLG